MTPEQWALLEEFASYRGAGRSDGRAVRALLRWAGIAGNRILALTVDLADAAQAIHDLQEESTAFDRGREQGIREAREAIERLPLYKRRFAMDALAELCRPIVRPALPPDVLRAEIAALRKELAEREAVIMERNRTIDEMANRRERRALPRPRVSTRLFESPPAIVHFRGASGLAPCGASQPHLTVDNPDLVTCLACLRAIGL